MWVTICKSKIHRVTVTDADLNYEGSITIDKKLLDAAQILPHEKVQVLNLNNGARFDLCSGGKGKFWNYLLKWSSGKIGRGGRPFNHCLLL
jgi:hypothetical protein